MTEGHVTDRVHVNMKLIASIVDELGEEFANDKLCLSTAWATNGNYVTIVQIVRSKIVVAEYVYSWQGESLQIYKRPPHAG